MATTDPNYTGLLSSAIPAIGAGIAANQAAGAQSDLASQQLALGQQAANNAQFRPVGVTSRFGTSGFQYDQSGNLIGAGYQVAPDIAAMREGLLGYAGQNLANAGAAQGLQQQAIGGANSLFNFGQQYVAQGPNGNYDFTVEGKGIVFYGANSTQFAINPNRDGKNKMTGDFTVTGVVATTESFKVDGTKVVGNQGAALSADATDLASAITLVNEIKARLQASTGHGLVAG